MVHIADKLRTAYLKKEFTLGRLVGEIGEVLVGLTT